THAHRDDGADGVRPRAGVGPARLEVVLHFDPEFSGDGEVELRLCADGEAHVGGRSDLIGVGRRHVGGQGGGGGTTALAEVEVALILFHFDPNAVGGIANHVGRPVTDAM